MTWSLKKFLKLPYVQTCIAFLLAGYCRLVYAFTPWHHYNSNIPLGYLSSQKTFIVCFWHGRLMMLPFAWRPKRFFSKPFYMLISGHSDGKLISRIVAFLGIHTISGSSTKGGGIAFRSILSHLKKKNIIGITPDGPNGPAEKVKMGIIHASYYSQCDIIPVTFSTSHHKIWKSWDSFFWAYFSKKGAFVWGNPIKAPSTRDDKDFAYAQKCLEIEMKRINSFADKSTQGSSVL